jgi:hypothetical protein
MSDMVRKLKTEIPHCLFTIALPLFINVVFDFQFAT